MLGCGLIMTLILGIIVGGIVLIVYKLSPELNSFFQRKMQNNLDWEILAEEWSPPAAAAPPETLFPPQFSGYALQNHDTVEGVDDLGIKSTGRRATYRHTRGEIEVFIFRVTEKEKTKLITKVQAVINPKKKGKGQTVGLEGLPPEGSRHFHAIDGAPEQRWFSYSFSPPMQHGFFWWDADWLFLVRSSTVATPEQFLKDLLNQYGKSTGPRPRPTTSKRGESKEE